MIQLLMRLGFLFVLLFALAACESVDLEQLGVDADDNAVLCVQVTIDPTASDSGGRYSRIEFPASMTISAEDMLQLLREGCP